jgi:hypothetical protein
VRRREVRLGALNYVAPARVRYERARTDSGLYEVAATFSARDD